MTEWWTYRLSDFLMFSAPTYYRLFERHNAALWPWQWLVIALGSGLAAWLTWLIASPPPTQDEPRRDGQAARLVCAVLALAWGAVAWAFLLRLYAPINSAASVFALGFAFQALALLGAASDPRGRLRLARGRAAWVGLGLLMFALWGQPAIGPLMGRPWAQAEVFALAPDPTVLATLGVLLLLRRADASGQERPRVGTPAFIGLLWPLPLLWCAISGATLWTMHAPDAALMPAAGAVALCAAWLSSRHR